MGYFMGSQEVPINSAGTTVSDEGSFTTDCIAVATAATSSLVPTLVIQPPELFAVATAATSQLDIYGYSTRECFAVSTAAVAELDIGLRTDSLLYYDPVYE